MWLPGAEPEKEWRRGFAYLMRVRSIVVAAVSNTIGFGALWKNANPYLALGVLIAGTSGVLALVLLRFVFIKTCATGDRFHRICHEIREMCEGLKSAAKPEIYAERFNQFQNGLAENFAEFFRTLLYDKTICCAIRLASSVDQKDCYETFGRSRGMSVHRDEHTKPIPAGLGVPQFLRSKSNMGVCVINDIKQAAESSLWFATPNDALQDVKFLAIAPINSYEGGKKSMFGMICITSKARKFGHASVEPLKGFADMLGLIYAAVGRPGGGFVMGGAKADA